MFYSSSTNGFYLEDIHGYRKILPIDSEIEIANPDCLIPLDAVQINDDLYTELMQGQSHGQIIFADTNGLPALKKFQKTKADEILENQCRLSVIDQETLRPLRAVYAGTDTQADHDKLAALEAEAVQLRGELNAN